MSGYDFYNKVTNSKMDIIKEFLELLEEKNILYCVIGGIGINAYCEPIVTLDFDCVIFKQDVKKLTERLKERGFKVKTHPYTWEVKHRASDIRIQIQRDERYQQFIKNAQLKQVLGYKMRVAKKEDLLIGKIWAYKDPTRDALKKDKDMLDIKRLIRRYPKLKEYLPTDFKLNL